MPLDRVKELVLKVPADVKFSVPLMVEEELSVRLDADTLAVTPAGMFMPLKFPEGVFNGEMVKLPLTA